MKSEKINSIDENFLRELVNKILNFVNPVKIILFGSYAYGNPTKSSDLDILVVLDDLVASRRETRVKIRSLLREFHIPKDIIVATTNDIDKWANVPQAFITSITKKGKVIYERKS